MNKHLRISIVGTIAVVLLFAIVLPAMAKPEPPDDSCVMRYPSVNNSSGTILLHHELTGSLFDDWQEGTLINECTGDVPFGEKVNPRTTWLGFDDLCDLNNWTCDGGVATITSNEIEQWTRVWDMDEEVFYPSDFWKVEIFESGKFEFYKEYTP